MNGVIRLNANICCTTKNVIFVIICLLCKTVYVEGCRDQLNISVPYKLNEEIKS
jgi:hypothetical protein